MGVSVELISKAQLAFDDELKLWTRHGTWRPGMTMLRRDELRNIMAPIGPADVLPEATVTEHYDIPDDQVHSYLFFRAMEKALEAVQDDITQAAVSAVAAAEEAA
ncbi:hypothetical protein ACQR1W_31400 [Bradyrhizobium sp. HKCCYLS1011]|uniref:hypothetical protein n=1 Tax=Bradyrhizobium sp. HKCCYLS1011 TaxID=3420733 RepID=UPI003EBEFEF0